MGRAISHEAHEHREVVVALRPGADRQVVEAWLRASGLDVMPMVVGVLATGDARAVRAAFGPQLRVPPDLQVHVESVAPVAPKRVDDGAT